MSKGSLLKLGVIALITISLLLQTEYLHAQITELPTAYVDCVMNAQRQDIASRKLRSPTVASKAGSRAFAVVSGDLEPECHNTSMIYVAEKSVPFRLVYQFNAEKYQLGNGVSQLLWSPRGDRLLVLIKTWQYASDAGLDTRMILYETTQKAKEIALLPAIQKWVSEDCNYDLKAADWIDEEHFILVIHGSFDDPGYEDTEAYAKAAETCEKTSTRLSYDVVHQSSTLIRREDSESH
jgi:hypothetical protein